MWVLNFRFTFVCCVLLFSAITIIYGIENKRPAIKACEELENSAEFPEIQDFPFNVAVVYENFDNSSSYIVGNKYGCAGVLVAKKFVLTAGHCLEVPSPIKVLLGLPQTFNEQGHSTSIYLRVKNAIIHPDYLKGSFRNDIGVLELENEVSYLKSIYPTCLQTEILNPNEKTTLFASGIRRYENRTLQTDVLLKGSAKIEPSIDCKEISSLDDTQLCVLESDAICDTISGSALVSTTVDADTGKRTQRLIGIKIAGFPCVYSKHRIYTKISAHLDFIENIIWQKLE